jgi:hypothetical protein
LRKCCHFLAPSKFVATLCDYLGKTLDSFGKVVVNKC